MFNTLKYAKMLQDVGFSKDQAETSVGILVEIMEDKLATKEDLQILKTELKADLTVRMGTMLAASIAILTAILKFV